MGDRSFSLTVDHRTYTASRQLNEHSNTRLWAIQKQNPSDEAEYHRAATMALFWYYCKTLGCEYNAAVQRRVNAIDLQP